MQPKRRSSPPPGSRQVGETELGYNMENKDYGLKVSATVETMSGQGGTHMCTLRYQKEGDDGIMRWYATECNYKVPARPAYSGYRVIVWMGAWIVWTQKVGSVREGIKMARSYAASQLNITAEKPGSRLQPLYPAAPYPAYTDATNRQMELELT